MTWQASQDIDRELRCTTCESEDVVGVRVKGGRIEVCCQSCGDRWIRAPRL